jgi:hypothetical protein
MKTALALFLLGALTIVTTDSKPSKDSVIGTWKVVRHRYGNQPAQERNKENLVYKTFTRTRWSAAFYNKTKKQFDGAGGGTYVLNGDQYKETVEYYSWDSTAVDKTFVFSLKLENDMLHQTGTIEYKGNPKYIIEEWFARVD